MLVWKLSISPSILNEILAGYSNLGCRFFSFSTLNISCHFLLACRVSAEWSAVKSMGFPLYVACYFSFAAFNIQSLSLVFISLISMCLGVFPLGFILYGTLCASWTLSFFMMIELFKFFLLILFSIYHVSFRILLYLVIVICRILGYPQISQAFV